jgi:hypothetical protein
VDSFEIEETLNEALPARGNHLEATVGPPQAREQNSNERAISKAAVEIKQKAAPFGSSETSPVRTEAEAEP